MTDFIGDRDKQQCSCDPPACAIGIRRREWERNNWVLLLLAFLMLTGCASVQEHVPAAPQAPESVSANGPSYWWYVRFRMHWPQGEEPPWYPDLFVADRVIGPILDTEKSRISLWRFHRRAARDGAGRQFSFIFYASPGEARRINARIAANPLLAQWERRGVIEKVLYDDPTRPRRPSIASTSDKVWTPEMQRAWPYYIMGVSRLWLGLIREYGDTKNLPRTPKERYAAISRDIDSLWRNEGGHALLHHLSAMFAYQEIEIVRRESMRF